MIIGLGGLARSGKDTFYDYTSLFFKEKGVSVKRFAFADELKKEVDSFCVDSYGISAFTDDEKEKEIIRPILVAHGMIRREASEGLYWINKIKNEIKENSYAGKISVITDVRFENEIKEINSMGGKSIHITRENNIAPNQEETENDPKVKSLSLYSFTWEDFNRKDEDYPKDMVFTFLEDM